MSSLVYPVLPGLAFDVTRTPRFSTSIQQAISGAETRIQMFTYPMYDYELVYEFLRSNPTYSELQQLVAFFCSVNGSWDNWFFTDPDDNAVTAQQIGVGNGSQTIFQLARSFGGYTEPVYWPLTVTLYVNGVATGATAIGNGQYQFASAPASGAVITWTGTFYYKCRFADDKLELDKFMNQLWEAKKVAFTGNLQGRL